MLALKGFSRVERSLIPTATMARLARQIPNLNAPHQSGLYQASIDVKSYGVGQWRGEPKSGRVLSKSRPEKWAGMKTTRKRYPHKPSRTAAWRHGRDKVPHRSILTPCESGAYCRSEEHTSELQSLMRNSYAGFCFKNKTQI